MKNSSNSTNLSKLSTSELCDIYLNEVGDFNDLRQIAKDDYLKLDYRISKKLWYVHTTKFKLQETVNRHAANFKHNVIRYIKRHRKNDTKQKLSKLIVSGIANSTYLIPAINEIPKAPKLDIIPKVKYGNSEEYKLSHYGMNFDEYSSIHTLYNNQYSNVLSFDEYMMLKNTYDNNDEINAEMTFESYVDDYIQKVETFNNYLFNNTNLEWKIDFTKLKWIYNKRLRQMLEDWFNNVISELTFEDKYMFHFKVNGIWHSKPMSKELCEKLYEVFMLGNFIYEMDKVPDYEYSIGNDKEITLPDWNMFEVIEISKSKRVKANKDNGGSFFPYLNNYIKDKELNEYFKRLQIFNKLTDKDNKPLDELNDCCFIYALKQTGMLDDGELNQMRLRITTRYISQKALQELCEEFNIKVYIHIIELDDDNNIIETKNVRNQRKGTSKSFIGISNASDDRTFYLNLFHNHYFIEERTHFTSDYIKHIDEIDADIEKHNKRLMKGKWVNANFEKDESKYITSRNLVIQWYKMNYFSPITFATSSLLKTYLYDNIKDENYPLEFNSNTCVKKIEDKDKNNKQKQKQKEHTYWYADFEADVSGNIHKPFMCVLQNDSGSINITFKGEKCGKQLLEYLPNDAVCYFHNLSYDWCMIINNVTAIQKVIKKGSKVYQAKILYINKHITFKDSLPIFMCKLEKLPEAFGLDNIVKELFPYKYYTLNRLESNVGIIDEAGKDEDIPWDKNKYIQFNINIDNIPGCRIDDNHFDMYKYADFYCKQDVKILRLAFEKLCDGFMKEFNIDVKNILTTPTLANEFFNRNVYYPNGHLYAVGGHVRQFISRAVYGGRCMCAYNKKWHSVKPIYDYDAVSLYPSAMHRLWTVEGKPEVLNIPDDVKDNVYNNIPEYLTKYTTSTSGIGAYVIEISITKVNKHYAFPLIVQHTVEGNINDDKYTRIKNEDGEIIKVEISETNPVTMVVDNIMLEDLIEFQHIEFKVIKGYIWNGKRDYKIQEVIQQVFESRLKYKANHNPLEQLYKLIMNSSYGKTIQKPVENDLKFFNDNDKYEKYIQKNYHKVIEVIHINDKSKIVKIKKQIDKHFNFSLLGIQVLSMSKRIMNEVMCLAFDIGCHIYYQDTDSMHIEADELPKLEEEFKKKYKRDLKGKIMGCFHSDFPTINNHNEIPKSIEAYFIAKKLYIDHLQDSTGEDDFMIRGKGLTQLSIKHAGDINNGLLKLYEKLFKGEEVQFDLAYGQPCFDMKNDFTISSRKTFIRKISSAYDIGKREDYFKYID